MTTERSYMTSNSAKVRKRYLIQHCLWKTIFFSLDVNGSCQCTFTLDRKYVVKRITDDTYYYETEYVYAEFRNIPPIEKLRSKKIPIKVWFNRKNHRVTIKIGKKVVADKNAYFANLMLPIAFG